MAWYPFTQVLEEKKRRYLHVNGRSAELSASFLAVKDRPNKRSHLKRGDGRSCRFASTCHRNGGSRDHRCYPRGHDYVRVGRDGHARVTESGSLCQSALHALVQLCRRVRGQLVQRRLPLVVARASQSSGAIRSICAHPSRCLSGTEAGAVRSDPRSNVGQSIVCTLELQTGHDDRGLGRLASTDVPISAAAPAAEPTRLLAFTGPPKP